MRIPPFVVAIIAGCLVGAAVVVVVESTTDTRPSFEPIAAPPTTSVTSAATPPVASPATTTTTTTPALSPQQQRIEDGVRAAGLTADGYASAHAYVQAACDTFPSMSSARDGGVTVGQWLAGNAVRDPNGFKIYRIGVPLLCPTYTSTVEAVARGTADVGDGSYEVGSEPGKMKPGKWKAARPAYDCYWERTDADGEIIDNNLVSYAPNLTITVAKNDVSMTLNRCPTMEYVG